MVADALRALCSRTARRRGPRMPVALSVAVVVAVSAACATPAPSDTADEESGPRVMLVADDGARAGYERVIPAFLDSESGEDVTVERSFGDSDAQSRAVTEGQAADLVSVAAATDLTRLIDRRFVAADWPDGPTRGMPFASLVTLVVREGNPKGISDWSDLLRPGVEVVMPDPVTSGSGRWTAAAPYAVAGDGGRDAAAGAAYLRALFGEHVRVHPATTREAAEMFFSGEGDVLVASEADAIVARRDGHHVEHVTPPETMRIDPALAVVEAAPGAEIARTFSDFLYTERAQRLWAESGLRPVDPAVAAEFADAFPVPRRLWTVDDLGGWDLVGPTLFDPGVGVVAVAYDAAGR